MKYSRSMDDNMVSVVGAGNMGSGIAQKYATHGYIVNVVDKDEKSLNKSQSLIRSTLEQAIARKLFSEQQASDTLARLRFSSELEECASSGLVIEAIFEDLDLKQNLFTKLEDICPRNTIFATNTSSLLVKDIGQHLKYPDRMLGLHYFYPPAKNKLVEVIATPATDDGVMSRAKAIQESINKVVIVSKDSPGFIVNRFFVPWLNEAMHIVNEGLISIATVEHAVKSFFDIGMGPFELMNVTGLPITFYACESLARCLGPFYAPCPLIKRQMESGMGFDLSGEIDGSKVEEIGLRMLSVVGAISHQLVNSEGVASKGDTDLGARVGLLWKKGPFELLDEYGARLSDMPRIDGESTIG